VGCRPSAWVAGLVRGLQAQCVGSRPSAWVAGLGLRTPFLGPMALKARGFRGRFS
jgi:hypothetical protein